MRLTKGKIGGRTSSQRQWDLLVSCIPMLRAHVRRLVSDPEAAAEILQEVSLRILVYDGPIDDVARFHAWCRGVARHVAAHHTRTRRRTSNEVLVEEELEDVYDPGTDPETHIDARKTIARAAADLEPAALELLVRRYVLEETGEELADELAETPSAVRMRLMRLRATLRSWTRVVGAIAGPLGAIAAFPIV